jgi:hypothetical protein
VATAKQIIAELWRQAHWLDFDHKDGVGKALMDIAVDGILESMDRQQAPDGTPWDKLQEGYRRWKARRRPGKKIGEFDGILKARAEVEGRRQVDAHSMTMTYGVTTEAIEHAWFGVDRDFYGITRDAEARMDAYLERRVRRL